MATFFGLLFVLAWPLGVMAGVIWLVVAALSRISSLAALVACALCPFVAVALGYIQLVGLCMALAVVIIWCHRDNIYRIIHGTEARIGR